MRERALKQLKTFDHGPLFTPPSERGTLMLPGIVGGANWGGGGFDPETGIFYVPSRMNPSLLKVTPGATARTSGIEEPPADPARARWVVKVSPA